jgi:homoserine kinase
LNLSQNYKLEIDISSEIPKGSGLGSSAAYSSCLSKVLQLNLSKILQIEIIDDYIINYADFLEKLYHGNPSGADVRITYNGGCMKFKKVDGIP